MKIGEVELKHGIFLAPMAGVTDITFRSICRKYGAEFVTSEMISAKAVTFNDKKTHRLARLVDSDYPAAIQLFGSEPKVMGQAAKTLCELYSPSAIDINMGCPVGKITGNGEGSALMREPLLAGAIMRSVRAAVDIPVTVKIRKGWNGGEVNAVEIAKIAEDCGLDAVTVHGRTKEQMYAPPVDFDIISQIRQSVKIPVIGNGDIYNAADAIKMFELTGCGGIMVGRGALGNPWIFTEINTALDGSAFLISESEKYNTVLTHLDGMIAEKGEKIALFEARKHLAWYIKGIKNAAILRNRINFATSRNEYADIMGLAFSENS